MENVVCPGTDEQELIKVISWLIVFGDGTEKCQKVTLSVRVPELDDAVNPKWPPLRQLWGKLAAMLAAVYKVGLILSGMRSAHDGMLNGMNRATL
jgi:hypothetical protein